VLTIAPLKRWSVRYYNDTSRAAVAAGLDGQSAGGGLGEYYSESETRSAVWLCAGDAAKVAGLVGLSDVQRAGGDADLEVVARWLDDGVAPNGAHGNAFGPRANHGFDLTFCAPKSVSVLRAQDTTGVWEKGFAEAHNAGIAAAMEYLAAHAGYTRVHNAVSGKKDLVRLPGLVAVAYQHETSRAGDPHLHTHVLLPNKQPRADGKLVAVDSDSLWHEAKAAGVVYQVTVRRRVSELLSVEWGPVAAHSAMAEVAGVDPELLAAASQRSTQLAEWAAQNLVIAAEDGPTAAQLARAQKATRPRKPEHRPWAELKAEWVQRFGEVTLDAAAQAAAREQRIAAAAVSARDLVGEAVAGIDSPAFTRADLIEALGARMPVTLDGAAAEPRAVLEGLAERAAVRITEARAPHEREGHERYTAAPMIAEEVAIFERVTAASTAARIPAGVVDTDGLSPDQAGAVEAIASSPWLVQVLCAPAGSGKTTSLRALRAGAHAAGKSRVLLAAPTGRAVDVALAEGAGDAEGSGTVARMLADLRSGTLTLDAATVLIVDEAGMVGTPALRELLDAAGVAGTKTVLVGDPRQLAPVKARGGMFAQLAADLPWAQQLSQVWRMRDPAERAASLAVRDGDDTALAGAAQWYREHQRLHTGDPVTMAADALAAWTADGAGGVDSLLIADRWEIADALNERLHRTRVDQDAPTVGGARRAAIGVGDIVISRRNDAAIPVFAAEGSTPIVDAPVRNGQRWLIERVDVDGGRVLARRLGDRARVVFEGDYLRRHVHHGYAVTVHAAQGATADRCHAVLSVTGTRSAAYVAMTRGRDTNCVYLYERIAGEGDHEHADTPTVGVAEGRRGDPAEASAALLNLLGRDDTTRTVTATAAVTDRCALPAEVVALLELREQALNRARQDHDAERRRRRAAAAVDPAVLVERTDIVAAATEMLAAAGQRSTVVGHRTPPAETVAGLDEQAREAVRRIAVSHQAVQPVQIDGATDIAAVVRAIAATADLDHGHQVLALPGSAAASNRATAHPYSDVTGDPHTALDTLRSGAWTSPRGGLIVVDDADHLAVEQLRALTAHAAATGTKLLLITGHTSPAGPNRELTDALAAAVPWAQHLGTPTPGQAVTLWERARNWLNTQPPHNAPARSRQTLDPAAESRSTATVYTPPTDDVLRGLDGEPARRAVRHIAVSAMNVTTVTLNGTSTTADARAALLGALAATAAADRHPVIAVPATPAAAARAATNPALRTVADPDQAAMSLHTRGWKLPPGALIVVDDADHCPAHRLNSLIRYAQRDNTKLVLITDHTAPPGPSRALTDALAAAHPWAHHRLGEPDTTHSIAARLRELLTSYDTLTATYRDQHQQELRFWSNWERTQARYRERSRNQHRTRNDGNDLSL